MEFQPSRASVLHRYIKQLLAGGQFAGVSWCLELRDSIVDQGVAGFQDVDAAVPITEETLFRLYSMTKPVVSVHCLQLIEAGLLQLDDPVSRWIPEFGQLQVLGVDGRLEPCARAMHIEDLLTHRSGLSYDFLPDCAIADEYRAARLAADGSRSLQDLATTLASIPLAFQPGSRWYYSYATDVLASIIERVSDQPLSDCLQNALFDPLGMSDTGFQVQKSDAIRLAKMYGQRDLGEVANSQLLAQAGCNELRPMNVEESYPASDQRFSRGGIGLFSTIADYRRFMSLLMDGKAPSGEMLLSRPMLDLSWTNRLERAQIPIAIGEVAYPGYGWGLTGRVMADPSTAMRLSARGEGGWSGAASTHFWVDRANRFSGIVMTQYLGSEHSLGADVQALAYAALG
ncbi:MAG: beta-lactamase family protein [Granulosicoccus sp.]|nr:beta-lactamase family protein [Granulosicoccus sp.]